MDEIKNYEIETSITLDYRKSAWGLERIVLDGVANHLPDDSKGTNVSVKLKQEGQYVILNDADQSKKTEEVVFEDDGPGYDVRMLSILFSSKETDELSVGQFGEGLKLVAAAALRSYENLEYHSRNWIAKPFAKPEWIDGHSIDRLCFTVQENGFNLNGSRTILRNPSESLIKEIYKIPDNILAFSDSYKVLGSGSEMFKKRLNGEKSYLSKIIELNNSAKTLFIKGVKVQNLKSIFSYDLGLDNITPDRIFADRERVLDSIECLLKSYASRDAIKTILEKAHNESSADYLEFHAFYRRKQDAFDGMISLFPQISNSKLGYSFKTNAWAIVFKEVFGENAVLESFDTNENGDAELLGYKPIKLNSGIRGYLMDIRIKTVCDIVKDTEYRWIDKNDLTESEITIFNQVDEINKAILGIQIPVDVMVYSGLFTKAGREIESSHGVFLDGIGETKYIGIRRDRLSSLEDFTETYIHELGHQTTGAGDADRRFTTFFVKALSKRIVQDLNKGK